MNGAEDIQRLQTIPGVGDKTALAFTTYVGDGKRFNNGDQVAHYLGLVPRVDCSGSINRYGHITKKGNRIVRALLYQAAWERNWNDLIEFFNYPMDIRKAIYTTNAIESLNFSLRKITRNKSSFPDDDSIYKVMYLAIQNASKRWTMPIRNWALAVNQFAILFDKRVPIC